MFKNSILWYCTTNSFSRGMRHIEGTYTKLRTVYGNSIFVNLFLYFRGYFNNLYKSHPPILPSATQPIHIHCTPTPSQKYEFLIEFPSNTNMNTIRLFQYDRIRIRILVFGLNYSNTIRIPNYSLTSVLDPCLVVTIREVITAWRSPRV